MLWPFPSSDRYWKVQDPLSSFSIVFGLFGRAFLQGTNRHGLKLEVANFVVKSSGPFRPVVLTFVTVRFHLPFLLQIRGCRRPSFCSIGIRKGYSSNRYCWMVRKTSCRPICRSYKYGQFDSLVPSFLHLVIFFQNYLPYPAYFFPYRGMAESKSLAHLPDGKAIGIDKD